MTQPADTAESVEFLRAERDALVAQLSAIHLAALDPMGDVYGALSTLPAAGHALLDELDRLKSHMRCHFCERVFEIDDPLAMEHWRTCERHPAHGLLARLERAEKENRDATHVLLHYATRLETFNPMQYESLAEALSNFIEKLWARC
jgi:hypothetical protein